MKAQLLVAFVAACGAARPIATPSPEQCQDLAEYIGRLSWQARTADTWSMGDGYGEARFMYEKEFAATKGPELLKRCQHLPLHHVKCALAAEQLDQVIACDAALAPP